MWGLLKSFLLMPYVNCWNSPENRLPPFKENDFSVNGDPLPFGLYLLDSFYPVPYLFQFFFNIFLCKKLKPIMEDLPEEFNYHVDFFFLYTFVCCYFRASVETLRHSPGVFSEAERWFRRERRISRHTNYMLCSCLPFRLS